MLLYHGTSEATARKALTEGLRPRGRRRTSNWEIASEPNHVYLTVAYAGYFAMAAADEGERWGIIEIDTDRLDEDNLRPDEDFLEQASLGQAVKDRFSGALLAPSLDMIKRTAWFRKRLWQFAHLWETSIAGLGNCAHEGIIAPAAITRVSFYDPASNPMVTMMAADPTISLMNYRLMSGKYHALTRWFMGDAVAAYEFDGFSQVFDPVPDQTQARWAAMDRTLEQRTVEVLCPGQEPH